MSLHLYNLILYIDFFILSSLKRFRGKKYLQNKFFTRVGSKNTLLYFVRRKFCERNIYQKKYLQNFKVFNRLIFANKKFQKISNYQEKTNPPKEIS